MTLKNLFKSALLLCCIISSSIVFAQQLPAPEVRAKNQTGWMQNNLKLTPEQNQKAYAINLAHAQEVDKILAAGGDKAKLEAAHNKKDGGLQALLTPEQFKKNQAHEAQMKQKMQKAQNK